MKIDGKKIYLETGDTFTGCGYTFEVIEKQVEPQPVIPQNKLSFLELVDKFNEVLKNRGYHTINPNLSVYYYLRWANDYTDRQYNSDFWVFKPETYPLVYNYRGNDNYDDGTAYNALQAWLMASCLAELVPDSGETTNTQTELFKLAYELGGGRSYALYNTKSFKADPYAMREAASVMYAICRGDENISNDIEKYRKELGGKAISASDWNGLNYKNTMLSDNLGRRGYRMNYLGYCVNTQLFLPDAPGPRIPTTTVYELPQPWEQGQPKELFTESGNYIMDEVINNYFVTNYNMMTKTPLSTWNSYSTEKKNRMVNVAAIPSCTFIYMFGKKNVQFDGIIHKAYGNHDAFDYYCFSQTNKNTGLALEGPFSEFEGIYRYNSTDTREQCLDKIATIFDNFRFPTEDPNYGRCRPGCKPTRQGGELNPIHGSAENEIYNTDLCTMVADNVAGTEKGKIQEGFASDSPRSYVSGHSAQIWGLALMLTQMKNGGNCEHWIKKAFEYSVNRSIGRFHWNSDCVYGRLFGAMALPIINAMTNNGFDVIKDYIMNPQQEGDWKVKLYINNQTGKDIQSTGEIRLYVDNHIGINTYLPGAAVTAGALYTFKTGMNDFSNLDVHCVLNGEIYMSDKYNGKQVNEVRFYDSRHWNSDDCGFNVTLEKDNIINKSGATYILKITNK